MHGVQRPCPQRPSLVPRPRRGTVGGSWKAVSSDDAHVGGVGALGALFLLVLDLRAVLERLVAAAGDRGVVDEEVLAVVVGGDEAVALVVAEPLHGSSGHQWTSGRRCCETRRM